VLTLRPPGPGDEDVARAAQAALQAEGFDFGFLSPGERWSDYLTRLEREGDVIDYRYVPVVFGETADLQHRHFDSAGS